MWVGVAWWQGMVLVGVIGLVICAVGRRLGVCGDKFRDVRESRWHEALSC